MPPFLASLLTDFAVKTGSCCSGGAVLIREQGRGAWGRFPFSSVFYRNPSDGTQGQETLTSKSAEEGQLAIETPMERRKKKRKGIENSTTHGPSGNKDENKGRPV